MQESSFITENVPLAPYTTFKIGGAARYFAEVVDEEGLLEALAFAALGNLGVFVLGGGSNVLISDEGVPGLVIKIGGADPEPLVEKTEDRTALITVDAGADWDRFVSWCVEQDLAGIECLSGIPGLVGGTPIQNVGAYGQEVSETVTSVRVFDRKRRKYRDLSRDECGFGYRSSIFNTSEKDRFIVMAVTYRLKEHGTATIGYPGLEQMFKGTTPNLKETREAVCDIRASKGMLVRQGGADAQSAGSFFKNPLVDTRTLESVSRIWKELESAEPRDPLPRFPAEHGLHKIPAAWLIEKAGFSKGYKKGKAGLSTLHSLAITNRGGAAAQDIIGLKREIEEKVADVFGIVLVPEPNFIGFGKQR